MCNILITGGSGQLGMEFKSLISDNLNYNFIYTDFIQLDITNHQRVKEFVLDKKIEIIINCAAYTLVDQAETEQIQANKINHLAVANIAQLARDYNVKLIHISTDYVFDGKSLKPYTELDITNPQTVYGKTKLKGEMAILSINPRDSIIIRTSWLFSSFGKNFVNKILKLAKTNKTISVVSDQFGSPTYAGDLVKVILEIIPKINNTDVEIFHYSNEGVCSWYEFAQEIFKIKKIKKNIISLKTKNYDSVANRPVYSALNNNKIKSSFNLKIPIWKQSLREELLK